MPPTETHPNYGIYRFKHELGARFVLCAAYHDHVFRPLRYRLMRQLERHALPLGHHVLELIHRPVAPRRAVPAEPAAVQQAS